MNKDKVIEEVPSEEIIQAAISDLNTTASNILSNATPEAVPNVTKVLNSPTLLNFFMQALSGFRSRSNNPAYLFCLCSSFFMIGLKAARFNEDTKSLERMLNIEDPSQTR